MDRRDVIEHCINIVTKMPIVVTEEVNNCRMSSSRWHKPLGPFGIAPDLSHAFIAYSLQIDPILHILACSGPIKVTSGDLEFSHRALSICCSIKA
eukprot:scaffold416_cov165-Skeletonema_dohrnii-CCMP3373.AAC.1